jgi:hypothetical protein
MTVRKKINAAFKQLQETAGFFIYDDDSLPCCTNCGIPRVGEARNWPYAFYHAQDADAFNKKGNLKVPICIAYGDGVEAGAKVKAALQAQGLTVEWDGNPALRIKVTG